MELRVPHPRIHRRSFVLRSMVERAPQFVHPVLRRTQRQLLDRIRS
jgi:2-amino-4-hydroxy-6-hydroxymethyldihydropteridine diphosphokinase